MSVNVRKRNWCLEIKVCLIMHFLSSFLDLNCCVKNYEPEIRNLDDRYTILSMLPGKRDPF